MDEIKHVRYIKKLPKVNVGLLSDFCRLVPLEDQGQRIYIVLCGFRTRSSYSSSLSVDIRYTKFFIFYGWGLVEEGYEER